VKRTKTKKNWAAKSSKRTAKKATKRVTRRIAKKTPKKPARKTRRKASPKTARKAARKLSRKTAHKAKTKTKAKIARHAVRTKSIAPRRRPSSEQTKPTPKTEVQPRRSATPTRSTLVPDLQARRGLSPLSNAVLTAISDLDLVGHAKDGAEALLRAHPDVVFTSGRRSLQQQAGAMAGNVVRNRNWIRDTYAESPERYELQTWVDSHPDALTREQIMAGLRTVMSGWNDARKMRLSRHFAGFAFDVQPVAGARGEAIKTAIRALSHLRRFLDTEGGMVIWHTEFEPG
jgi:hypothetical protein